MWCDEGIKAGRDFMVFNGPDEQLPSGLAWGAVGGIGGTYAAIPELYLKIYDIVKIGDLTIALDIQNDCCRIIYKLCPGNGNMYGMIKEVLLRGWGPDCGSVLVPLTEQIEKDYSRGRFLLLFRPLIYFFFREALFFLRSFLSSSSCHKKFLL